MYICLRQPHDFEYTDAGMRPIYCVEDSRIMWSNVSSNTRYGTYM